jgi:hypothetical protein
MVRSDRNRDAALQLGDECGMIRRGGHAGAFEPM